jgi:hypothetical protein
MEEVEKNPEDAYEMRSEIRAQGFTLVFTTVS